MAVLGKQDEERQGSNAGQSNDARNADTQGDVVLPPLPEDFENEENTLSDDEKKLWWYSGFGGVNPEVCLTVHLVLEVQNPDNSSGGS